MRRSIVVVLIALAALSVPAAGGKNRPPPPAGTWELVPTRTTYSGPANGVRAAVTRLIAWRATFTPTCDPVHAHCVVDVTLLTSRRRLRLKLSATSSQSYAGALPVATRVRCGGRRLPALVTVDARLIPSQGELPTRLLGLTRAILDNPGGCTVFQGRNGAARRLWFSGVSISG